MKLKHAIVAAMDRDTLKAALAALGLGGVDRRSTQDMGRRLSRAHRATPAFLLGFLDERQVKAVCDQAGLPSTGRRKALVSQLLDRQNPVAAAPARSRKRDHRKRSANATRRESPRMSASDTPRPEAAEAPVRLPEPPPGMFRITRTELVWPGKYDEHGNLREPPRVNLPFQVIERVNESRATREARKREGGTLFDLYHAQEGDTFEEGWRNKLIWGDNLLVMSSLLEKFAGKIDLIYIDPPFATGADFSFTTEIGESGEEVTKEQSVIEEKAYRDTWGSGVTSYLSMIAGRLRLMVDLLSANGTIYIHLDYRLVHQVHVLMTELLGLEAFKNDVVWSYGGRGAKAISGQFPRNHDVLLVFAKGTPIYNRCYQDIEYDVRALPSHIKLGPHGEAFKTSPRGE